MCWGKGLRQEHNKSEKQAPLREPDLLIILTGGSFAYTRPDSVKVIPLACLKDWVRCLCFNQELQRIVRRADSRFYFQEFKNFANRDILKQ